MTANCNYHDLNDKQQAWRQIQFGPIGQDNKTMVLSERGLVLHIEQYQVPQSEMKAKAEDRKKVFLVVMVVVVG